MEMSTGVSLLRTAQSLLTGRTISSEKMDLKGHYPQNTISYCIISNETQITLHFFQGRISAMPEIRADLFLAVSKTGICLLTSVFFS